MDSFSDAIGLRKDWPHEPQNQDEMSITGLASWAQAYLRAAEVLNFSAEARDGAFYAGPVVQSAGLATELTLKAVLRGLGQTENDVKKFSHNTYEAYCEARVAFDEVKFLDLHFANTSHLKTPQEVRERLEKQGEKDVDIRWRVYFDHLRILDTSYHRPFRARYVIPGAVILPEITIVLTGTKILLSALQERLRSDVSANWGGSHLIEEGA
ncbi:MAG: hypothetical protein AAGF78_15215 [Pseudomonadota bacterium]